MGEQRRVRWKRWIAWAFAGILTVLVIPKANYVYWKTRAKQREHVLPDLIRTVRVAVEAFRAKHGRFPIDLREAAFVELLSAETKKLAGAAGIDIDSHGMPMVELYAVAGRVPDHQLSSEVETYPFLNEKAEVDVLKLKDTGHWLYDPKTGTVLLDCTHRAAVATWTPARQQPFYVW